MSCYMSAYVSGTHYWPQGHAALWPYHQESLLWNAAGRPCGWNEFTSKVSMNHAAMHPRTTSTFCVPQSHTAILATILCVSQLRLRHFAYVRSQYLHFILALFRSAANPSANEHLLLWSPQHKNKYVYICRPTTTRFTLSTYWNLDCMSCKMPAVLRNKGSWVVVDHDTLNEDSLALVLINNTPFGGWFFLVFI